MTTNSVTTEKNRGNPDTPMENHEKGTSTGLIVAGLVTIVGSWVGMAAYMDYRLEGVEQRIAAEARQVTSAYQTGNSGINQQLTTLGNTLTNNSAILANGLKELITKGDERFTKGEEHFNALSQAVNAGNSLIERNRTEMQASLGKMFQDSEKQITSILSRNQDNTEKAVTKAVSAVAEQQDAKNQAIVESLTALKTESTENGQKVLATLTGVDKNLADAKTGIFTQIETSSKSLTELVKLSNNSRSEQLTQLASTMSSLTDGLKTDSKKNSTELTALAQRLNGLQQNVVNAQSAVQELNKQVPEWKENSAKQLAALNDSAKCLDQKIQENLSTLEKKVAALNNTLDTTSNTLMKSLYSAAEGLEGTKVELKSEMAGRNQETRKELQALSQSIRQIETSLETLKENMAKKTSVSQSSGGVADKVKDFSNLFEAVRNLTDKMTTLRAQVNSQTAEAKARAKTLMEKMGSSDQAKSVDEVFNQFNAMAEQAAGQLDSFTKGLDTLSKAIAALSATPAGENNASAVSTPASSEKGNEVKPASSEVKNPEERTEAKMKVSLN